MANKIALTATEQNMEAFIILIKHKITVSGFSDLFYAIHFFSIFRWLIVICLKVNGPGLSPGSEATTVNFHVQGPASEVVCVDVSIVNVILGSLS